MSKLEAMRSQDKRPTSFILALFPAVLTPILLVAGALVTSTGSSLAVPDWPLAYDMWIPPMVGGILFEHGHRMIAGGVMVFTLILAVWVFISEERPWVRRLAIAAVALIFVQALLGGLTVLLGISKTISVFHALIAQIFFLSSVLLAQVLWPQWENHAQAPAQSKANLFAWGMAVQVALVIQLLLGATTRHNNAGLSIPDFPLSYGQIIPPSEMWDSFLVMIHFAHRAGAYVVTAMVIALVWRVYSATEDKRLRRAAHIMGILVAIQFALGAFVILSEKSVTSTVLHLFNGALLFGATGWFTFRARMYGRVDSFGGGQNAGGNKAVTFYPLH